MKNPFAVAQRYLDVPGSQEETGEREPKPTTEALAVSILVENQPDEVEKILTAWRDLLGIDLDKGRVTRQLEDLRQRQSRWVRR